MNRIEFLRNKMTEIAMDKGFTSPEAIKTSQELDKLLNLYESMKQTNSQKEVR
ncbi:Spo0E family sporulation regulatory protein-aspartic acid phosphatase [Lentibacillus salinarum]|uniref:Spo0E family sporulation regulatory protein-aspartic acid phosphatase n=1 Tax=Lentibacillus salinarum TaxID=446820 RepID=A0ABW3ZU19_9BACI